MHIAVLIPCSAKNFNDTALLQWVLDGYSRQHLPGHTFELRVGIDGGDHDYSLVSQLAPGIPAEITGFPRMGAAAVRNMLAARAPQADLLLFGNADARPAPDMIRQHCDAFASLPNHGQGHLVLGSAPWEKPASPTVFDALLADSPMIFFYHALQAGQLYDFRHAWTLNLSVRSDDFRRSGGFHDLLRPVYYEDLAFGLRLLGPAAQKILYHPAAIVTHRHPTSLDQYLDREELLGLMAPVLAKISPDAFHALFQTTDTTKLAADYQTWTSLDHASHKYIYQRLKEWALLPESALGAEGSEARTRTLMTLYQMHIPLKRLAFRLGFLAGLPLTADEHWQKRTPTSLWRKIIT